MSLPLYGLNPRADANPPRYGHRKLVAVGAMMASVLVAVLVLSQDVHPAIGPATLLHTQAQPRVGVIPGSHPRSLPGTKVPAPLMHRPIHIDSGSRPPLGMPRLGKQGPRNGPLLPAAVPEAAAATAPLVAASQATPQLSHLWAVIKGVPVAIMAFIAVAVVAVFMWVYNAIFGRKSRRQRIDESSRLALTATTGVDMPLGGVWSQMKNGRCSIRAVHARQILNSKGQPTIEIDVQLADGSVGRAATVSESADEGDAVELPHGDTPPDVGEYVSNAIADINELLGPDLIGKSARNQQEVDDLMTGAETHIGTHRVGTHIATHIGMHGKLAVSVAVARAYANSKGIPLYQHIAQLHGEANPKLPIPMATIINGGGDARNGIDFQGIGIVPVEATTVSEGLGWIVDISNAMKQLLEQKGLDTSVGENGGFTPDVDTDQALDYVTKAIEVAGYIPGQQVGIAINCGASRLYEEGAGKGYRFWKSDPGTVHNSTSMASLLNKYLDTYPIISIEEPLYQHDVGGYVTLIKLMGHRTQIVASEVFASRPRSFTEINLVDHACNAILVRDTEMTTISGALKVIKRAQQAGFGVIASIASGAGGTEDTFIADLAVGAGCGQIQTGSVCGTDHIAMYNQLVRIEETLGPNGKVGTSLLSKERKPLDPRLIQDVTVINMGPRTEGTGPRTEGTLDRAAWERGYESCTEEITHTLSMPDLPKDFPTGTYYRNGGAKFQIGEDRVMHPFDADGMVTAVTFGDDKTIQFRNRYVQTKGYLEEKKANRILYKGQFATFKRGGWFQNAFDTRIKNVANTNVIHWGDKLLALWEGGKAHELDASDLSTKGEYSPEGVMQEDAFSAHPRFDPKTNRMINFRSAPEPQNNLTRFKVWEYEDDFSCTRPADDPITFSVPEFSLNHDFAITDNWYVFSNAPTRLDMGRFAQYLLGQCLIGDCIRFDTSASAYMVLVPRSHRVPKGQGTVETIRIPLDTHFTFHFANAYEDENGTIIADCVTAPTLKLGETGDRTRTVVEQLDLQDLSDTKLTRYELDPNNAKKHIRKVVCDRKGIEFPVVPRAVSGQDYRYTYAVCGVKQTEVSPPQAVVKVDVKEGDHQVWIPKPHETCGEPCYVPKIDSEGEDDGYVVTLCFNGKTDTTDLLVFDAKDVSKGPISRGHIPLGIPHALHGSWAPGIL